MDGEGLPLPASPPKIAVAPPPRMPRSNRRGWARMLMWSVPFLAIAEVIEQTLTVLPAEPQTTLDALIYADLTARREAQRIMQRAFC